MIMYLMDHIGKRNSSHPRSESGVEDRVVGNLDGLVVVGMVKYMVDGVVAVGGFKGGFVTRW
jgi:hypothetical protein